MKLLFDQHLSPRLVKRLADAFPDSEHVDPLGLGRALDTDIWEFARGNGYVLVTKDSDYSDLMMLRGFPPKVVWLRLGNCTTAQVENLLRVYRYAIEQIERDPSIGLLLLS